MRKQLNKNEISLVLQLLEEMHPDAKCALDYDSVFHLLLAVVLSAQTTDVAVNKVSPALFERFPRASDLAAVEAETVEPMIRTIGLYKNKAKNIVKLARELNEKYKGEVPGDFEKLLALPGVGRKTANVILAEAFGEERIAVDTHVFRLSNRIGLCDERDVLKTETALMKRIPKGQWTRAHHLIIFHGRRVCDARKPKCEECLIKDICLKKGVKAV